METSGRYQHPPKSYGSAYLQTQILPIAVAFSLTIISDYGRILRPMFRQIFGKFLAHNKWVASQVIFLKFLSLEPAISSSSLPIPLYPGFLILRAKSHFSTCNHANPLSIVISMIGRVWVVLCHLLFTG